MHRTSVAVLVLLTLLTGLTLGKTSDVLNGASPLVVQHESGGVQGVADRFYSAVNYFLATGSSETLRDVLTADFRDHLQGLPDDRPVEALIDDLQMVRAEFPGVQLSHRPISLEGNTGVFSVSRLSDTPQNSSGIPAGTWPDQESIEVICISGNSIAERWSSRKESWRFDEFLGASWKLDTPRVSVPSIQRFTFDPGAELELKDHTGLIMVAETDGLAFNQATGQNMSRFRAELGVYRPETPPDSWGASLIQGEVVAIPPATAFSLSNDADRRAVVLVMQLDQNLVVSSMITGPPNPSTPPLPGGISLSPVASGGYVEMATNFDVVLGKLILAPGVSLPPYETTGTQFILPASGAIDARALSGVVVARTGREGVDRYKLVYGNGLCADGGSMLSLRTVSDEPATIWVLTFIPEEE